MRIRSLVAALSAAFVGMIGFGSPAAAADPAPVTPYIIGGGYVSSAPWAAAVFSNGSFTCSGSVISADWVLTARHCVSGSMSVRIGSVYYASGGTTRTISATYTRYDLALMRLSSPVSTSYVSLATSNPPTGSTNSIYGWGMTCYSGCSASSQLKTASVQVTGLTTDAYGGQAIQSTRINGNAWRGDSGGPQFYNGRQVGVASTANGTTIQNYGSVAYNRAWITSITGI
jgi:secreted trypsin-like serine protease